MNRILSKMGGGCRKPPMVKEERNFLSAIDEDPDMDGGPMELMAQARNIIRERKAQRASETQSLLPQQDQHSIYQDLQYLNQIELSMTEDRTRTSSIVHTHEQSVQVDQSDIAMNACADEELNQSSNLLTSPVADGDQSSGDIPGTSAQNKQPTLNVAENGATAEGLSSNTSLVNLWLNSNRECASGMPPIILQKYIPRFGSCDEKNPRNHLSRSSSDCEEPVIIKPLFHATVQTDQSVLAYYEDPQYVARPPMVTKSQILEGYGRHFSYIDQHICETPKQTTVTLQDIVTLVNSFARNDFLRVRAFFKWITRNIRYNWRVADMSMSAEQILQSQMGSSKEYCALFAEFCRLSGIKCQTVHGFAKDGQFRPGYKFQSGQNVTHTWNVVFLNASWRFVDCTWGTGYLDANGKFLRRLSDHFFLTDPSQLIWTHFPYDALDENYSRWQLLDRPITLDDFNSRPKVTAKFFEYQLKIRQFLQCPIVFEFRVEIMIESPQVMQYLFKVYANEDTVEDKTLKRYVFCTLKEERLLATFRFTPPVTGNFILKIYAQPQATMSPEAVLHDVVAFSLSCTKVVKGTQILPINDFPWGPTQLFYDLGLKLVNNSNAILLTVAGRKTLILQTSQPLTVTYKLLTVDGVTLDPKLCLAFDEKGNLLRCIVRPHMDGYFKLAVFAMLKKKHKKGIVTVPCVATFLVDCPISFVTANEVRYAPIPLAIAALQKREQKQLDQQVNGKVVAGAAKNGKNKTKNPPRKIPPPPPRKAKK